MVFADGADVIERRFESHIINARPDRTRYRSLTDTQLQIVRTLIRPGAAENPFPERLQLRNWLMIELLLETGTPLCINDQSISTFEMIFCVPYEQKYCI